MNSAQASSLLLTTGPRSLASQRARLEQKKLEAAPEVEAAPPQDNPYEIKKTAAGKVVVFSRRASFTAKQLNELLREVL